jgi:hypothetical protein
MDGTGEQENITLNEISQEQKDKYCIFHSFVEAKKKKVSLIE